MRRKLSRYMWGNKCVGCVGDMWGGDKWEGISGRINEMQAV